MQKLIDLELIIVDHPLRIRQIVLDGVPTRLVIGRGFDKAPIKTIEQSGKTIVTMKIGGNFDRTGLPEPFVMDFHFTNASDKINALSIHFPPKKKTNYLSALGSWMV